MSERHKPFREILLESMHRRGGVVALEALQEEFNTYSPGHIRQTLWELKTGGFIVRISKGMWTAIEEAQHIRESLMHLEKAAHMLKMDEKIYLKIQEVIGLVRVKLATPGGRNHKTRERTDSSVCG